MGLDHAATQAKAGASVRIGFTKLFRMSHLLLNSSADWWTHELS